jgi:hypothetical protein
MSVMTNVAAGATNFDELDVKGEFTLQAESLGFKPAVRALGTIRDHAWVPVSQLRPLPGYNVRLKGSLYRARLQEMVQQLVENGYKEDLPMTGFAATEDGQPIIYIRRGHTRYEAIPLANIERAKLGLPLIEYVTLLSVNKPDPKEGEGPHRPQASGDPNYTLDLINSNSGSPLGMYEQGLAYKRAQTERTLSNVELGRLTGKSEGHVRNCLKLLESPRELVDMIADGKIMESQALKLLRSHGADGVMEQVQKGLTKANSLGKTRVTGAVMEGFKLPPKVTQSAVQVIDTLVQSLDPAVVSKLTEEGGQEVDDVTEVPVPLSVLRQLLSVSDDISAARVELEVKVAKAQERAKKAQAQAMTVLADLNSAEQKKVFDTLVSGKELPDAELKEALLGQAGLNEEQAEAALVLRYQVDESADLFKAESSVE